jgi:hypothetical protein
LIRFAALGFSREEECVLNSGVFLVRNGRASWYATVMSEDRPFVRFDPGCMTSASSQGNEAVRMIEKRFAASRPVRIEWARGNVLIVDNWRILHGRESSDGDDEKVLLRVLTIDRWARRTP